MHKVLHIIKRTLHYYRQTCIVLYTAIRNKIFFRETDIHRVLTENLITV